MHRFKIVSVLAFATVAAVGCQDTKLASANKQLWQENSSLSAQLEEANQKLASAPDAAAVAAMQAELAAREAKIAELTASLKSDPSIAGVETSYDAKTKTLTVNLPGDVLFASGMSTLKTTATPTLDKIVAALKKDYAGKHVEVKGHTDSDPITKTKKIYKDNLELSLDRAATVTRYLEGKGVDPKLIKTAGFAQFDPKDEKNKKANRRVEIAVLVD